ncbi:hypothetical protein BC832DRAFT_300647 [Gaertneriomyces semiglobifer]|nr:hypothetical protein BC832DRAFT_300647 [Gaertneriomyces semiglobifer]
MAESVSVQYNLLKQYLAVFLRERNGASDRIGAKEKLAKLSSLQLSELSTDVYDEANRRMENAPPPFLPVQPQFPSKRNQARQKLATLQSSRFKELAAEVFFELERRYPDLSQQGRFAGAGRPSGAATMPRGSGSVSNARAVGDAVRAMNSNNRSIPERGASRTAAAMTLNRAAARQFTNTSANRQPPMGAAAVMAQRGRSRERPPLPPVPPTPEIDGIYRSSLTSPRPPSGRQSGAPMGGSGMSNIREEYETQIVTLKRQLKEVAASNDVIQLQEELEEERESLRFLQKKYDDLLNDYDAVREELSVQQRAAEASKADADALLRDVQLLSDKNQRLQQEKVQDMELIQQLKDQIQQLGAEGGSIAPSTPRTRMDSAKGDLFLSSDPAEDARVLVFQDTAERFIVSARQDQPSNLLSNVKAVILCIKDLTEESERLEATVESDLDYQTLVSCRETLSNHLADLVNNTKLYSQGSGVDLSALEDGVRTLEKDVRTLVETLALVAGSTPPASPDLPPVPAEPVPETKPLSAIDLKLFIEDQTDAIVSQIQNLLMSLKDSSPSASINSISSISSTVDNVIYETRRTAPMLDSDTRDMSEAVLQLMANSAADLNDLGNTLEKERGSKIVKQKIGNSAYEVAKVCVSHFGSGLRSSLSSNQFYHQHVKDLLGLFE